MSLILINQLVKNFMRNDYVYERVRVRKMYS